MTHKLRYIFALGLLAASLVACADGGAGVTPVPEDFHDIDPQFREFYNFMGGREVLGPVISPLFSQDSLKFQYTENALMMYDPAAEDNMHLRLSPVGLDLNVADPPVPAPTQQGARYVEGQVIYPEFVPLFESLGGIRFVGRPLSAVHYNPEERRYEQYFANLGFYRKVGDTSGKVRLLAYGAWKCDNVCRSSPPKDSIIMVSPSIEPPFDQTVTTLGRDFTGFALTDAYIASDGKQEKIFENMVMFADGEDPSAVRLRPVQELMNVIPDPAVLSNNARGTFFYPVDGDRGYNVPIIFLDFIIAHGGVEVSGPPISELRQYGNVYRQCFKNLCILYDPKASESQRIRLDSIGYAYKRLFYLRPASPTAVPGNPEAEAGVPEQAKQEQQTSGPVTLQVWEASPSVSSFQIQEIGVSVFADNAPLAGQKPVLITTLPNGDERAYTMPPTDENGQSRLSVPAIASANGTLIPYQVCINGRSGEKFCIKETYVIWNNP